MGRGELHQLHRAIKRIRNPGDPPSQSMISLDYYECDLCKGEILRANLIQCHYCGRWICKTSCWNHQHLTCTACASVIKIVQHQEKPRPKQPKKTNSIIDEIRDRIHRHNDPKN